MWFWCYFLLIQAGWIQVMCMSNDLKMMRVENWWNDGRSPVLSIIIILIITFGFRVNEDKEESEIHFSFYFCDGQFWNWKINYFLLILPVTHLNRTSFILSRSRSPNAHMNRMEQTTTTIRFRSYELKVNNKKKKKHSKSYGQIGPAVNSQSKHSNSFDSMLFSNLENDPKYIISISRLTTISEDK